MIIESVSKNLIEDLYKLSIFVNIPSTKSHLCKRNYVDRLPKFGIKWNSKKCKQLIPFMIHNSKKGRLQKHISLQGDLPDTMKDLLMDTLGGVAGAIFARSRNP